jgi:ribosomal protein S18 acetylase RimI-like enzyme
MEIQVAKEDQIEEIMNLIEVCIQDMEERKTYQWNEHYPTREIISNDIKNRELQAVFEAGKIIAIIVITEEQEKEYEPVDWLDKEGRFLIVHRLAVHPKNRRQGIAKKLMDDAEEHARKNGYTSIRLDTYSKNPDAIRFYEKRGYRRCGEIYFPHREFPFYCYELIFDEVKK